MLFSAMALPASAATTGDTPVTTEVTAGTLDITAPTGPVDLGAAIPGGPTGSKALGDVTVTDNRANTEGWIASAAVTDFTSVNVTAGTIPASASAVAYTATAATTTGTATVTATSPASVAAATAVQTATAASGNNTATWSPTIVINVPANALAATDYTATFTHSVA